MINSILSRYILRSLLLPFFCCLFGFIFVFFLANVQDDLGDMLKLNDSMKVIAYFLYAIPEKFPYIAPMSLLLATMYCFSSLNRNHEITAMRSSGLSLFKLCTPIYLFALFISISLFVSSQFIEPHCRLRSLELFAEAKALNGDSREYIFSVKSKKGSREWALFTDEKGEYRSIQLIEMDEHHEIYQETEALTATFTEGIGWTFKNAKVAQYKNNQLLNIANTPELHRPELQENPVRLSQLHQLRDELSIPQIKAEFQTNLGMNRQRKTELNIRKYSLIFSPLSCLISVLLGIPLAAGSQRQVGMTAAAKAIGLMFLYYIINNIFSVMGHSEIIPPLLAASCATIAFIIWGVKTSLKE